MNIASVKRDLLESLKEREFRKAFNLENVYATICFQLRALREQRELSQAGLGRAVKMAQERISILEDPNAETKPTLNTLLRLADGLDVGLEVRFVPFSTVLDRSVHTGMRDLEVASFTEELPSLERQAEDVIDAVYVESEPTSLYDVDFKAWTVAMTSTLPANIIDLTVPRKDVCKEIQFSFYQNLREEDRVRHLAQEGKGFNVEITNTRLVGEAAIPDVTWRSVQEEAKKKQGTLFGQQAWDRIANYPMLLAGAIVQQTPLPERIM